MRPSIAPALFSSLLAPMAPGCPVCSELMIFRWSEPGSMMYGHRLGHYAFECIECGYAVVRTVDEDRLQ